MINTYIESVKIIGIIISEWKYFATVGMLYNILLPINCYIGNSTTKGHSRSMSDNRDLTETFHQKISSHYKVIASAFQIFPILMNMLIMLLSVVYYHFLF